MIVSNHSGYPRVGESAELQTLRRTIEEVGQGKKTPADLARAQEEMVVRALEEQAGAGCDVLTDGQTRWYDPVSHFAANFEGVSIGSIFRFFDTNFLVRQPTASGKLRWKGPLTTAEYAFAAGKSRKPVKAVVTGPVTLARHTILAGGPYKDAASLAADYSAGLLSEMKALSEGGTKSVQVEEPSILTNPEDLAILKGFLAEASKATGKGTQILLSTYFNDAAPLYERLLELPVAGLVWDLTYSETLESRVASGFSKILGLGIVDARNTRLEKAEDLARRVERIAKKARGEVQLLPSASLEHLPRDKARAKLEVLAKAKRLLEGA